MTNTNKTADSKDLDLANVGCMAETTTIVGATGNRGRDVQLGLIGQRLYPGRDGLVLVLPLDLAIALREQLTKVIDEAWAQQLRDARSDPFAAPAQRT
jgi:hypothetical protein